MHRKLVYVFCSLYFSMLVIGTSAHTFNVGMTSHPAMYFFIWDMYNGWNAYKSNYRLVGEGISGAYYELDPAPWGSFRPYDTFGRLQHVGTPQNIARMGLHVANNSVHEPFTRILHFEEAWPKKFELPDAIYEARYGRPKDQVRYTTLRYEIAMDGEIIRTLPPWLEQQQQIMLADNPRLEQDVRNTRPFWMVDGQSRRGNEYFKTGQEAPSMTTRIVRGASAN